MASSNTARQPVQKQAILANPVDVFLTGQPMFIRFKLGNLDQLLPVVCQGIAKPEMMLATQVTGAADGFMRMPELGMEVQCQLLNSGVLYLAKGQIANSPAGRMPRLRIKLGEQCVGIKLRGQQRYAVRGKLEVLEPGGAVVYGHHTYQKMNISLGGFGTRLPEAALPQQPLIDFQLEVLVERDALPDNDFPALILRGAAELRHSAPSSATGLVYAGFSFSKLNDVQEGTLQFWLASHAHVLCAL